MQVGQTQFDPVVVGTAMVFGVLAVVLTYLMRDVLLAAPSTAFPFLATVWIGSLVIVVWLAKRRGGEPDGELPEEPWDR